MRITAGKFKNKEVLSYKDKKGELRPTSSKVRQAVFNLLQHGKFLHEVDFLTEENPSLIHGRVIADIYCGTGIMGFEAASRGAEKLIFVDMNDRTLDVTRKNAAQMGFTPNCYFVRANAIQLPRPPIQAEIVFMDPPYEMKLISPTLKSLLDGKWLKPGGIAIVEHSKREDILEHEGFQYLDKREYNNTFLSIFKFTGINAPDQATA
jgi:16S rRNA (guanine966-N2)-methyltransferase